MEVSGNIKILLNIESSSYSHYNEHKPYSILIFKMNKRENVISFYNFVKMRKRQTHLNR